MTSRITRFLLPAIILTFLFGACTPTPESTVEEQSETLAPAHAAQIEAIENNIKPRKAISGDEDKIFTLAERMVHYMVPGVSIAVIDDGKVAWAKGYGEAKAGSGEMVTPETRFQAASISKGVAAFGAVLLAQNGKLDLNADINGYLTRWQLPAMEGNNTAVNATMLMSHTGGLTVHGFPGYAMTEDVPTVEQVLDGAEPANTDPVRIDTAPGTAWSYSGGGYTILQLLMEEVAGEPFADYMQSAVLDPLGMEHSTFMHIPSSSENIALAHNGRGAPGEGGWHIYPEMAAAGLWTTPSDLAKYIIAVQTAGEAGSDNPISAETATLMTTPVMNDYGLGLVVYEQDGEPVVGHGGDNWGYTCYLKVWPERDLGIVIMTNSANGFSLYQEIVDAFARHNSLPASEQEVVEVDNSVDPAGFADLAGTYYIEQFEYTFEIIQKDGSIYVQDETTAPWQMHMKSPVRFFTLEENGEFEFQRDESGQVTGVTIFHGERELVAVRR